MRQASLCIFQDPVAKGRAKFTRSGFLYTPAKTRKSEASIKTEMRSAFTGEPFDNAIKVKIIFNLKRPKSVKRLYPAVKPDIDNYIKQIFDNNNSMDLGVELLKYNGDDILIFSRERLLIELIRNKCNLPFDYYKEIISSYRRMLYELDFQSIEEYAQQLPKTKMVMDSIQMEVF